MASFGKETSISSFLRQRETGSRHQEHYKLLRHRLATGTIIYKKDLLQHYGCVNAVEFSNDGEYLLSGGDDRRVLLWKLDHAISDHGPAVTMMAEHKSNIFCLGMDSNKTKIYSGGNDEQVIVHDVATTKPLDYFLHEEPIYGVSVHPDNDHVFLSAGGDGRVLIYDIRQKSGEEPIMLAGYSMAFHAAVFNPMEPRLVATANQQHGLGLWDIRKPQHCVLEYGNWDGGQQQASMSVRFNQAGTQILGLRRRLPPVLYNIHSPAHVCQFDHPGYYNSCTMKSCSFAGSDDEYILSGSDDFNLYMWKIPGKDTHWVDRAHMTLRGHRSIVNQVRYNYQRCLIASSGVEKLVKLWSVLPLPNESDKERDAASDEREVFSHDEYIGLVLRTGATMTHDYTNQSTDENPRMMAFFDSLVQREIEGWSSSEEDAVDGAGRSGDADESLPHNEVVESESDSDEGTVAYTRRERSRVEGRERSLSGRANPVDPESFYISSPFMEEDSYDNSDNESGIQNSPGGNIVTSSPAVSRSTNANSSSSSSNSTSTTSSSESSSVNLLDSGVETNPGEHQETSNNNNASNDNIDEEESGQNVERIPNRIDQLIAKKRSQLVKLAESKSGRNENFDEVLINKTIEKARKVIRFSSTESSSSHQSDNDSEAESCLFEESGSSFSPLPSTSRPKTNLAILQSLRRKRMKLMKPGPESDEEGAERVSSESIVAPTSTNGTSSYIVTPSSTGISSSIVIPSSTNETSSSPSPTNGISSSIVIPSSTNGISSSPSSTNGTASSIPGPSSSSGCSKNDNILEALKKTLTGEGDMEGGLENEDNDIDASKVEEVKSNPSPTTKCDPNLNVLSSNSRFNKPKKSDGRSYRKRLDE